MGREVVRAVAAEPDMRVVGAVDLAAASGTGNEAEIPIVADLRAALADTRPDVMVDFTVPEAALPNIRTALEARVIPLVGTTGLSSSDLDEVRRLCEAHATPALIAPNFAIGAVLLMRFAQEAARYLPDVEILEMHHEKKLDAPSGTAARTAELIAEARQANPAPTPPGAFEKFAGSRGGRAAGDIPVHSLRLPGFVASQEVIFGAPGQRLSLRHDSIDRASFMPGVVLAIRRARALSGLVVGLENLL
jgi:4-hydroxy-tetrahydrodipicolinate reductase